MASRPTVRLGRSTVNAVINVHQEVVVAARIQGSRTTPSTMEEALCAAGVTNSTLTPAQTNTLDEQGFLVIPEALDPGWLTELRKAFLHTSEDASASQERGTQHIRLSPDVPGFAAWLRLVAHPL